MYLYDIDVADGLGLIKVAVSDPLQKCSCGNTYVGLAGGRCTACIADDITRSVIAMRETLNGTLANNEGANEQ